MLCVWILSIMTFGVLFIVCIRLKRIHFLANSWLTLEMHKINDCLHECDAHVAENLFGTSYYENKMVVVNLLTYNTILFAVVCRCHSLLINQD